jgi:hypothetical protein
MHFIQEIVYISCSKYFLFLFSIFFQKVKNGLEEAEKLNQHLKNDQM